MLSNVLYSEGRELLKKIRSIKQIKTLVLMLNLHSKFDIEHPIFE